MYMTMVCNARENNGRCKQVAKFLHACKTHNINMVSTIKTNCKYNEHFRKLFIRKKKVIEKTKSVQKQRQTNLIENMSSSKKINYW